ncbi:MAG: hypothetical protein PHQ54_02420, partial [Candidatus Omnitrophica bacterium]|nr:hypothetical protein [Candidatus Omnitrophota bacterium]
MRLGCFVVLMLLARQASADFIRSEGFQSADCDFVVAHPFDSDVLYAASGNSIYKKDSSGWRAFYGFKDGSVNQIYLDPSDHSLVYIAADPGLAITEDGEHFETIFNSSRQGIKCLSLIRQ